MSLIMSPEEALVFVENLSFVWWEKAWHIWGGRIGPLPASRINKRLKSTAGRAFIMADQPYSDYSLYLLNKYRQEFENDTIPHELSHHIAWRVWKDRGHGKAWKQVAERLYGSCARTHTMESEYQAKQRMGKTPRSGA